MLTKKITQTSKKSFLTIATLITTNSLVAQTRAAEKVVNGGGSSGSAFWDWVLIILIAAGVLFMIAHMIYTLIKTKRFAETDHDIDYFKSKRIEQGKTEESSEEENEECGELLDNIYQTWSYIVEDEDGYEYRRPNKMKEIINTEKLMEQVAEIAPTDPEIVNVFRKYKEVISSNKKRSFDGSKKIIYLGLGIAILFSIAISSSVPDQGFFSILITFGLLFIIPVGVYYLASYTPQFLIEKRANRGGGNVSSGLVAMALAVMGSGYTVRYRYDDGTTEDDNSAHGTALFFGIIIMLIIAFTIIIWAVLNYLRNYVLFF